MREHINKSDAILALSLLAIIMPFYNSYPYLDDMVRLTYNYTGLIVQGRYLTEWFYTAMQSFKYTTFPDIYTFNLALIAFYFIALKRFVLDKSKAFADSGLLFILCILSSPFILENISYHIDSVGMFSSLVISITAGCITKNKFLLNFALSSILLFIATCFYQFSLNVYICTVAVLYISMENSRNERDMLAFIYNKVLALIASISVYMLIMRIYATDTYVDAHATIMTLDELNSGALKNNIESINSIIKSAFTPYYKTFFFPLLGLSIIGMIFSIVRSLSRRRYFSAACILIAPFICLAMIYLPAAIFSKPVIQPRILIAYGFFVYMMLVMALQVSAFKKYPMAIVAVLFAINVMTSSAFNKSQTYAINSTKSAMERIYMATPSNLRDDNGEVKVNFTNLYNHGMEFERNRKYFPVLDHLVRDPQKSPFLINGLNRYFRTGVKVSGNKKVDNCKFIGIASPWIYMDQCDGNIINVTFKNYY
ncbi:glucosyltransferase domain-containing protein [Cronobacter malonaticus]|uniref:glucosyltransferase domain-containing protein n=1 Tax=Cronobacter malonaticus TaxID=413503 RepID=UPI000517C7A5|nr:glucosyltransferase domain-containing protein [Cronobacter malonaticus]